MDAESKRAVGAAAEYTGQTWEQASEQVFALMRSGRSLTDAVETYRRRTRNIMATEAQTRRQTVVRRVVARYKIPRAVLDAALALAGGDISRLRVDPDGSVTVVNQSRMT